MVKTYLKYQLQDVIGLINGKICRPVVSNNGKYLYTGANEYINIFDVKTGEVVKKIVEEKSELTCLSIDSQDNYLVAGYNNGNIVIFDINNDYAVSKKFSLHKSAITTLQFNDTMNLLASGSKDTTIIVWDMIGESALYKLTGHTGNVTKIHFHKINFENFEEYEVLVSAARDNTVKLWNIKTQETLQTVADLVHKVTDFIIVDNVLFLGSYDNQIRLYSFQETYSKELKITTYVNLKGILPRYSNSKIVSIAVFGQLISILSVDNSVEFFKILSQNEIKRRLIMTKLSKVKKNEKKEKLVMKEKYLEVEEQVKSLVDNREYNLKFRFHSLFNFLNENKAKILSQFFIKTQPNSGTCRFGLGLENNSVEIYDLSTKLLDQNVFLKENFQISEVKVNEENLSVNKYYTMNKGGHRDIIRFVKFSDRDRLFLTCSNDSVKLWNYSTLNNIKSKDLENVITGTFINDDKYVSIYFTFRSSWDRSEEIYT